MSVTVVTFPCRARWMVGLLRAGGPKGVVWDAGSSVRKPDARCDLAHTLSWPEMTRAGELVAHRCHCHDFEAPNRLAGVTLGAQGVRNFSGTTAGNNCEGGPL